MSCIVWGVTQKGPTPRIAAPVPSRLNIHSRRRVTPENGYTTRSCLPGVPECPPESRCHRAYITLGRIFFNPTIFYPKSRSLQDPHYIALYGAETAPFRRTESRPYVGISRRSDAIFRRFSPRIGARSATNRVSVSRNRQILPVVVQFGVATHSRRRI